MSKVSKNSLENVAGDYGYGKIEDLYAALGYGKYSARQVLQKLAPGQVASGARRSDQGSCPAAGAAPTPGMPGARRRLW